MFVYLCGPMAENTPEQAGKWRNKSTEELKAWGFKVSSPMREKGMLTKGQKMGVHYEDYGDVPELTPQSIFARDQFDVRKADIILANMTELGTAYHHDFPTGKEVQIPSIGSDFELAWAFMLNKPVVLIAPKGNPYAEHPFLNGMSNVIKFDEVPKGVDWIVRNFSIYL